MTDNPNHLYLSRPEIRQLVTHLRAIHEWLHDELDTVLTRQTRYGINGTARRNRGDEQPLPFHETASDIALDLYGTLRAWTEHVATHRSQQWPGDLRADGYARWLDKHIINLALCPEAQIAADEITDAYKRAHRIIDRPESRAYQGACQTCGGDLWASRGADEITCTACQAVIQRADNDARIDAALEARHYTAIELTTIVRDRLGLTVKPKTIHDLSYRKTNPIPVRGRTYDHQNLYNAGEVLRELRRRVTA